MAETEDGEAETSRREKASRIHNLRLRRPTAHASSRKSARFRSQSKTTSVSRKRQCSLGELEIHRGKENP